MMGQSDLAVRMFSSVAMLAIAGLAIWSGGIMFDCFAALTGVAVFIEWIALTGKFAEKVWGRLVWALGGIVYIGGGVTTLAVLNARPGRLEDLLTPIGLVVTTDVAAYVAGRSIGGPKIAPSVSPSKTWAGLGGGMVASAALAALFMADKADTQSIVVTAVTGAIVAVIAQSGDFFESWMKRRAGVKDSAKLIPGHGGVFDRVDGLLAVLFVVGFVEALKGLA